MTPKAISIKEAENKMDTAIDVNPSCALKNSFLTM